MSERSGKWRVLRGNAGERVRAFREGARTRLHRYADEAVRILLSPWRLFKMTCFTLGFLVLLGGVGFAYFLRSFYLSIPDVARMAPADLQRLGEEAVMRRLENKGRKFKWVRLKDVNREVLFAIVLSEDATFFEHGGFNLDAMIDSLAENLKERKAAYGASTITQQVAKNLFLSSEKTLTRKLQEAFITLRLEDRFNKNDLLEVYLNLAEFGPDIYGINAAAHLLFRKTPAKLNAAQGALLAQLLPSPRRHYFQIVENQNLSRAKRRRIDRLLRDMLYQEYITDAQYRDYLRWKYFDDEATRSLARSR